MSSLQELKVTERDTTLTPRQLRAAGYIPATLSNQAGESQSIQIRSHEFMLMALQGVREFKLTGFVDCTAAIRQMQVDRVKQQPLSVQFARTDEQAKPGKQNKKSAQKAEKPAEPVAETSPEAETVLSGA